MKVGIISDIHSNLHALEAVEKKLREYNVEEVWCLGDVVGYGAFPNECVDWVKKNCKYVILGNHEFAVLGITSTQDMNPYARKAIEWTKDTLKKECMEFLEGCPVQEITQYCQLVHDTPVLPGSGEYILTEEDAYFAMLKQMRPVCFFGHTHVPKVYKFSASTANEIRMNPLSISGERLLINPGSVGQPRDRDPRASFGVLDLDDEVYEQVRVEYDFKKAARAILDAGLPEFLAARIVVGV